MTPMTPAPKWFTPVVIVALLWNLLGCLAFAADAMMTKEAVAKLPEAQQALYNARPAWALAATGVGVICGALGCVALLMKRKWATPLFVLSLLGVIAQDLALATLAGAVAAFGIVPIVLQSVVLIVCVLLVFFARKAAKAGWIG